MPAADPRPLPDLPGVSHEWIDAAGLRTHIAVAGAPEAPPLLCVHGWPQHWYMWRKLIGPLAEQGGFRVICPDLRGFGWTATPGHGYDPRTFSTDLLALLDALEIERARVLAHDWGGFAGNFLACHAPERVERLITLNIPPPWVRVRGRGLLSLWRFWYQASVAIPGLRQAVFQGLARDTRVRRRAIGGADWSGGAGESFAAQFAEPERARAASALYRFALLSEEPAIMLGRHRDLRLTVPALLLFGVDDFALHPSILAGAGDCADDLEIELVPGCGHFIAEERDDLVLRRVLEFFS